MKIIIWLGLAYLIVGTLALADTPVKIGYITDLSGQGAFFGVQSQRGARLALKDLLAQGKNSKLLFEDSQGKPSQAVTAAIRLLEIEKVDAIICDLTIICTAVAPKVKAADKVLIYHSPAVSIRQNNNLAFRNFIDYRAACRNLAEEWQRRGLIRVGSLMPNLEFADLCLDGVKDIFPDTTSYRYNPGDDLRAAILTLKSKQVQAVVHVAYEKDFIEWFKLCLEQKFKPLQGFMDIMLSQEVFRISADVIEGSTVMGYADLSQEFVNRLDKEMPSPEKANRQGAALAYNSVVNLYTAIEDCSDRSTDCVASRLRMTRASALLGFTGFGVGVNEYPVTIKELHGQDLKMVAQVRED